MSSYNAHLCIHQYSCMHTVHILYVQIDGNKLHLGRIRPLIGGRENLEKKRKKKQKGKCQKKRKEKKEWQVIHGSACLVGAMSSVNSVRKWRLKY